MEEADEKYIKELIEGFKNANVFGQNDNNALDALILEVNPIHGWRLTAVAQANKSWQNRKDQEFEKDKKIFLDSLNIQDFTIKDQEKGIISFNSDSVIGELPLHCLWKKGKIIQD